MSYKQFQPMSYKQFQLMSDKQFQLMSDKQFQLKRFENVTTMIRYHNDKMIEAFNRFNTLVVAIIGGTYTLLSFEHLDKATKVQAVSLVPYLLWLVAISTLALIISNCKSWYGFRKTESVLSKNKIPAPTLPRSVSEQIIMAVIILVVCIACTCLWGGPVHMSKPI